MRYVVFLLFLGACKVDKRQVELTRSECEASANYAWDDDRCRPKELISRDEAAEKCIAQNKAWINGECYSSQEILISEERCKEVKGVWREEPGGNGACIADVSLLNSKDLCEQEAQVRKEEMVWLEKEELCVTKECSGGIIDGTHKWGLVKEGENCFSEASSGCVGRCLEPKEYECLEDQGIWRGETCVSMSEASCLEQGYHNAWNEEEKKCENKDLLDYCRDYLRGIVPANTLDVVKYIFTDLIRVDLKQQFDSLEKKSNQIALIEQQCELQVKNLTRLRSLRPPGRLKTSDLTPFLAFENVSSLNLKNFGLESSDLNFVSKFKKLRNLALSGNKIDDLSFLSDLINLETLVLNKNEIEVLTPLSGLLNLRELFLVDNKLDKESTDELVGTKELKLKNLNLSGNCELTEIKDLVQLGLESLDLTNTGIAALWANKKKTLPTGLNKLETAKSLYRDNFKCSAP